MAADPNDVKALVNAVKNSLPRPWAEWPGGWPGEIEAALIDAALSIRASYGQAHNGVRGSVSRWRDARGNVELNDLQALASSEPESLATALGNQQRLSGGSSKARAIVEAARNLVNDGVRHAADLEQSPDKRKRAYTSVRGLGPVTWEYFLMLLGTPGIKADTWILRFVERVLQRPTSPDEAHNLLTAAANAMDVSPTALDHAIWSHERRQP